MLLERAASVWVSVMRFISSNVFIAIAIAITTAFFLRVASVFVVAVPCISTVFCDSQYSLGNAQMQECHVALCRTGMHSYNVDVFRCIRDVRPYWTCRDELDPVAHSLFPQCLVPNPGTMQLLAE